MKAIAMLFATMLCALSAHAQIAVIANQSVAGNAASISKLKDLYTLATSEQGGKKVKLLDYQTDTPEKTAFYEAIDVAPAAARKLWLKAKLTGSGAPPESVSSEDEMLARVESTPGAIGYVSTAKVKGNVKVLAKINE